MIKNIIFDLGNVLLCDTPSSILNNLDISSETRKIIEDSFFKDFRDLDLGNITLKEHLNNCGLNTILTDEQKEILLNYYKYRAFNNELIELMHRLNDNEYDIYILSNNNKETFTYLKELPIFRCVKGWIMSCDFHLVKPNKELYLKLLNKYNLNAKECFFIDDSTKNIEVAKKLGMNGHIFNYKEEGTEGLIKELKENNVKI